MKVSKAQKDEIRKNLLNSAVSLFTEKGFNRTTMREISTSAGYSAGTIYSYFPNKERIFLGYFEEKQRDLFVAVEDIEAYETYSLKERLQTLLELQLEIYLDEREFVEITFRALMDSPMKSFTELKPSKDRFTEAVEACFAQALEQGEIPPQPFGRFISQLFWEYKNLIVLYWLRDESVGFTNTSRLIDASLDLFMAAIQSDIVTKSMDLAGFLVKSHLYGNIDKITELFGLVSAIGNPFREQTRDGE